MTKTVMNGVELKHYDELQEIIKQVEEHFIETDEYKVYPPMPPAPSHFGVQQLFRSASEEEKDMMFMTVWLKLLDAYRHWTADLDKLWTDDGRKEHEEFIEKYNLTWKNGERNWGSFF